MLTRWAYLIAFDPFTLERDKVTALLDSLPLVHNWYTCMSSAVFVISGMTASQLTEAIHRKYPEPKFVITEFSNDFNGWVPQQAWDMVHKKHNA